MVAKKLYSTNCHLAGLTIDKLIDYCMSRLFHFADYVCSKCSFEKGGPAAPQSKEVVPTIRFSTEDKAAVDRVKCDACISTFEREKVRSVVKIVEGELFKVEVYI